MATSLFSLHRNTAAKCAKYCLMVFASLPVFAPAAHAGVYNTGEPDEGPLDANYYGKFYHTHVNVRSIGAPQVVVESPLRKRYLLQADLFGKVDASKLSAQEKLNFSAALIRRHRSNEAVQLLLPAVRQHPDVFLLQSNLATAYHQGGDKARARDTMRDCLDAWPKDWHALTEQQRTWFLSIGWNEGPYAFYREVDEYYYKLLKLRSKEPKGADGQYETVDALFDVKFVGESGQFEIGKISKAEKAKLPRKALEIVEQLLVWMPDDLRLLWLLGEVLNANGSTQDIKGARKIFDDLVWEFKLRADDVKARRQTLNEWVEPMPPPPKDLDDDGKPAVSTPIDWRRIIIAFAVGVLVTIFGRWQLQEIRRRRHPA